MRQVTRNIEPDSAHDLLERAPRACIAFASDEGPRAQPVSLMWRDGRFFVGIPADARPQPGSSHEVVLLVDEGVHFFDLRAVYIRGQIQPADPPGNVPPGSHWFEVFPTKTVAWDYGELREISDAD